MTIGILISSISNFGQKGFYNAQEVGFAKRLDEIFEKVIIYKLVSIKSKYSTTIIDGCEKSEIQIIPSKQFGINGLIDTKVLDKCLDGLIHFSDTQFSTPSVYKWAIKNGVKYIPYIGVLESHSPYKVIKFVTNLLFYRNIAVYKKCECFTKTPEVQKRLSHMGVKNIKCGPVGLDLSLVRSDYISFSVEKLKKKHGYTLDNKILLYIGRLTLEKQPIRMIEIFAQLKKVDKNYCLLMVGTGELKKDIIEKIKIYEVESSVKLIDSIPNSDIWELYRIADTFVNLNQQEIFGMAILEAMYYSCKVVAWRAPGPDLIIENGITGFLVENEECLLEYIKNGSIDFDKTHTHIINNYTWKVMTYEIHKTMSDTGVYIDNCLRDVL